MAARRARLLVTLLGLLSGSCVALGYDFGEYQLASAGSAGDMSQPSPKADAGAATDAEGGAAQEASTNAAGAETSAAGGDAGPVATTFGAAGGPHAQPSGEGGAAGAAACQPRDCWDAKAECGALDDGCGRPLDCGPCFWWFEECVANRCIVP